MKRLVLLGGWLLLFNTDADKPFASPDSWERVRTYDTAWLCEEGRREKAEELSEETAKKQGREKSAMLDAMLRYRCEHEDRARGSRRPWWKFW